MGSHAPNSKRLHKITLFLVFGSQLLSSNGLKKKLITSRFSESLDFASCELVVLFVFPILFLQLLVFVQNLSAHCVRGKAQIIIGRRASGVCGKSLTIGVLRKLTSDRIRFSSLLTDE